MTPSTSPAASQSPSERAVSQQSTTPTTASSSASPTAGGPSRTASPAAPSISGVAITSVSCVGGQPIVNANATVTSNGKGGTVTFSWSYETAGGTAESVGSPVTVSRPGRHNSP